jgi:hypothetical protein
VDQVKDSVKWVSWAALLIGVGGVVGSLLLNSTRVGKGLVFGLAAFVVFFAVASTLRA